MYFLTPFSVSGFVEFLGAFFFSSGKKLRAFPQNESGLYSAKAMI
jgi:hypothetical protein